MVRNLILCYLFSFLNISDEEDEMIVWKKKKKKKKKKNENVCNTPCVRYREENL